MTTRPNDRPVSMPDHEARRLADHANAKPYDTEIATKLAWRPAWSIRSRRGAWAAFQAFLKSSWQASK